MNQFEEVFDTLNSLREELHRLRRIEQDYMKLKQTYEMLLNTCINDLDKEVTETSPGFYFYADEGKYTGYSAHNIEEFAEAIKNVTLQSIKFHLEREDFENWLNYIDHKELAQEFKIARETLQTGDELKQNLIDLLDQVLE
jgi:hypothetical protein